MEQLLLSLEWVKGHVWVAEVALLIFVLTGLNFLLKRALARSKEEAVRERDDWKLQFDLAILAPARAVLWVVLVAFLLDLFFRNFEVKGVFSYVSHLRNAGIVLCFAWFLMRWKKDVLRSLRSKSVDGEGTIDLTSIEILNKVGTIVIITLSFLVLLSLLSVDIVPLVTFGGIGAAALGFASKDVMANFFGGLMLHVSRPFALHDMVELPQKKVLGQIERIGWYFTAIRDMDKKLAYLPNNVFTTELLVNYSRMTHRYLNEVFTIRFGDAEKVSKLTEKVLLLLRNHAEIDQHQRINVHVAKIGDVGIDIEVKAYIMATRYELFMDVRQEILLDIGRIFDQVGVDKPLTSFGIVNLPTGRE